MTIELYVVCSYHVTYAFQSESTLFSCLNVKELFARSRREIWPNVLVWPNGWVFVYEPNGSGFESSCSQLNCMLFIVLCYANWKKMSLCIGVSAEFYIYITGFFMKMGTLGDQPILLGGGGGGGGHANFSPPPPPPPPPHHFFFRKVRLEKLFICCHPADPTLEVSTLKQFFFGVKKHFQR